MLVQMMSTEANVSISTHSENIVDDKSSLSGCKLHQPSAPYDDAAIGEQVKNCILSVDLVNNNACDTSEQCPADCATPMEANGQSNGIAIVQMSSIFDDHSDSNQVEPSVIAASLDADDEFADFTSFQATTTTTIDDTNFANFNCAPIEDDEFADFETADVNLASTPSNVDKDYGRIFQNAFNCGSTAVDSCDFENNSISDDLFDDDHCSSASKQLWSSLQTIDLKTNFCYNKWKDSCSFKCLLESLKIDQRLVPNELFPAFASNLGAILQPTISPDHSTTPDNTFNTSTVAKTSATTKEEFPISNDTQPVYNEDLDFFESKYKTNGGDNISIKDNFIDEFEDMLNAEVDEKSKQPQILSQSSPVNDLKEMLKNSINNNNSEQVLSAEALQIISELPNLSFIRAKVLMFPHNNAKPS